MTDGTSTHCAVPCSLCVDTVQTSPDTTTLYIHSIDLSENDDVSPVTLHGYISIKNLYTILTPSVPLSLSLENRAPLTIPLPERQTQWDGGSICWSATYWHIHIAFSSFWNANRHYSALIYIYWDESRPHACMHAARASRHASEDATAGRLAPSLSPHVRRLWLSGGSFQLIILSSRY